MRQSRSDFFSFIVLTFEEWTKYKKRAKICQNCAVRECETAKRENKIILNGDSALPFFFFLLSDREGV